jgi:hypothetical protein
MGEFQTMSAPLRICYRADFEGPKGLLNPSGWKVPGKIGVEVRKISPRKEWAAYRPGTEYQFTEITPQIDPGTMQQQIILYFQKQASKWQIYELTEPSGTAVLLKPEEIYTDQKGRVYRK